MNDSSANLTNQLMALAASWENTGQKLQNRSSHTRENFEEDTTNSIYEDQAAGRALIHCATELKQLLKAPALD